MWKGTHTRIVGPKHKPSTRHWNSKGFTRMDGFVEDYHTRVLLLPGLPLQRLLAQNSSTSVSYRKGVRG